MSKEKVLELRAEAVDAGIALAAAAKELAAARVWMDSARAAHDAASQRYTHATNLAQKAEAELVNPKVIETKARSDAG